MLESAREAETCTLIPVEDIDKTGVQEELQGTNENYLVITNVQEEQNTSMHVTGEEEVTTEFEEKLAWMDMCRVCANVNDHLIPIYEGEGLQHELCDKIHKYLPIKVSQEDTLPLHLCYHCAATLLAWHELLEGCLSAERKLIEMREYVQEKEQWIGASISDGLETTLQDTNLLPSIVAQSFDGREVAQDDDAVCKESSANDPDRFKDRVTEVNGRMNDINDVQCVDDADMSPPFLNSSESRSRSKSGSIKCTAPFACRENGHEISENKELKSIQDNHNWENVNSAGDTLGEGSAYTLTINRTSAPTVAK